MAWQFDEGLSTDDKHRLLLKLAEKKLTDVERAARTLGPLYEVDYDAWQKLMLALETMQHNLGLIAEEEKTLKVMLEHSLPGQEKNWSALNMMSRLLHDQGRYAEREQAALEVQPWMEAHPRIGRGSPLAMGNIRMILTAVWKQRWFEEAQRVYEDMRVLVDGTDETKFAQYQKEERQMLQDLMAELEKWKQES
ncbi:putative MalT-like TPR region domain-containing protein [Seiridium unicorne]|uniref:MalT-like TPR region domain-containing protein n=1 Tax=Seiridium unicorne TaxID=138068 RepID=A0ABR2URR2_9PEZI